MSVAIIKRFKSLFLLAVIFSVIITGLSFSEASAATPTTNELASFRLVPPCTGGKGECTWTDFIKLLDNFLKFSVLIAVPIAAIVFMYAGFLYLTARGNAGQISKASQLFINVAIGFIVVMGSFLFIRYILKNLADSTGYINLLQE
jgi:hypothetical protein